MRKNKNFEKLFIKRSLFGESTRGKVDVLKLLKLSSSVVMLN